MAICTTFYTWCSPLGVGCTLYSNIKRTATLGEGYVSDGTTVFTVNSLGVITGTAACVFEYRAYYFSSNGYAGTISWRDCNGNTQSVYNDGTATWSYIVPCALAGSITWSSGNPNTQGCYMSIGFPCDCGNLSACENYTITASGSGLVRWVDCNGTAQSTYLTNGQTTTICARKGSVWNFATTDYVGNILQQGVTNYTGGGTRGITDNGACLPYGTYIETICIGCDLWEVFADGNGGTYNVFVEANSSTCGCTTCYSYQMNDGGWVYYTDCAGYAQYQYFEWYDGFCAAELSSGNAYQNGTC